MKVLIINPHPDDSEVVMACSIKKFLDLGWDIHEILMTSDEYGTKQDDFKGNRIKKIRMHEMEEAAKVYGVKADGSPKINLIWFGEIDGFLPFNRKAFNKLRIKVQEINPDIVIGPDSFFSLDLHPDHLHTGWLAYLVIKSIRTKNRPQLWLYHSWRTNFYVKFESFSIQNDAWAKHQSQTTPLLDKAMIPLRKLFYNLKRIKTGPVLAEGFRRVDFSQDENKIHGVINKIIYKFCGIIMRGEKPRRYIPPPKELGLIQKKV
jgi:LmbE family N-acetylglucosaminyl deacetylase